MKEPLISFETAKLAKEKGFNIPTRNFYADLSWNSKEIYSVTEVGYNELTNSMEKEHGFGNIILIPTQSLLQKWLREIHNIHIVIQDSFNTETLQISYYPVLYPFIKNKDKDQGYEYLGNVWKNIYEEALEQGLLESLKLIK